MLSRAKNTPLRFGSKPASLSGLLLSHACQSVPCLLPLLPTAHPTLNLEKAVPCPPFFREKEIILLSPPPPMFWLDPEGSSKDLLTLITSATRQYAIVATNELGKEYFYSKVVVYSAGFMSAVFLVGPFRKPELMQWSMSNRVQLVKAPGSMQSRKINLGKPWP